MAPSLKQSAFMLILEQGDSGMSFENRLDAVLVEGSDDDRSRSCKNLSFLEIVFRMSRVLVNLRAYYLRINSVKLASLYTNFCELIHK